MATPSISAFSLSIIGHKYSNGHIFVMEYRGGHSGGRCNQPYKLGHGSTHQERTLVRQVLESNSTAALGGNCPTATAPDQTESHVSLNQLGRIFVVDDRLPIRTPPSEWRKTVDLRLRLGVRILRRWFPTCLQGKRGGGGSKYCTVGR